MSSSDRTPPAPTFPRAGGRGPIAPGIDRVGLETGPLSRRAVVVLSLAALASCGFTPAYAPGGAATQLLGAVRVQDPTDRNGFDLVERLEERLGRPESERYDLAFTITTEVDGVGITTENEISRFNLRGTVTYTLTDRATGARVAGGEVQSFTAYFTTGSTVAVLAAEEDAASRLMRILADQIVARLVAATAATP